MVSILRKTKRGKRTSKYVLTLICIWGLSLLNLKLTDQAPLSIESAEDRLVKLQQEKYLLYWSHSGFRTNSLLSKMQLILHMLQKGHWCFLQFYLTIHSNKGSNMKSTKQSVVHDIVTRRDDCTISQNL